MLPVLHSPFFQYHVKKTLQKKYLIKKVLKHFQVMRWQEL